MEYPINDRYNKRIENLPKDVYLILSQIDQLKGRFGSGAGLGVQVLSRLKKYALVTSAGSSTRIEGAQMSDNEVRDLVDGLKTVKMRDRDKAEVRGYIDAANFIFDHYEDINMTENHLKEIHQILLKYSDKDVRHRGEYKHMPNDVVAKDELGETVGVVFATLSPMETPAAMEGLLEWFREAYSKQEYHPLLIIAGFVVEFLRIHPFLDGNGRMSRLITNLLMLKSGFEYVPYVSMERLIEENKAEYYIALRKSQSTFGKSDESISDWTQFFLGICLKQAQEADALVSGEKLETLLSNAQYEVYQIAKTIGNFSVKDIEARTEIPRPTIRQAIDKLRSLGVIELLGSGRGTHYRVVK